MMNELVNELNAVMDNGFERIVGIGKWVLYFERLKANNVKEIFRVSVKSKKYPILLRKSRYFCTRTRVKTMSNR